MQSKTVPEATKNAPKGAYLLKSSQPAAPNLKQYMPKNP
jgi:hypothetical protein